MSGAVFVIAVLLALFAVGVAQGSIQYERACLPLSGGTLTGPILAPNGAYGASAYGFSADAFTGIWRETTVGYTGMTHNVPTGQRHMFDVNGAGQVAVLTNTFRMGSAVLLGWSSNSDVGPTAADTTISRASASVFTWSATTFAALGTPANGSIAYCSDCAIANPCAGSGTGALAKRLAGAWVCD